MEWEPIETAPKDQIILITDGTTVGSGWWAEDRQHPWTFVDYTVREDDLKLEDGDDYVELNGYGAKHITHWASLPEPPK
jgi:hypothetical protein